MLFYESKCTDPRWNLALEEYIFESMDPSRNYFMLWQNHNTIVVGKNQNTVAEINNEFVREHGITVVRRLSGGGAVYHDLGNLNFTFITDADQMQQIDLQAFCRPIVETLRSFGVQAELSGRNDITVSGKKFSGNSQYLKNGRVMHHGTLMFNSDLSIVSKALRVDREKIESKGIKSVRSRVTNLKEHLPEDVTLEVFKQRLLQCLTAATPIQPVALPDGAEEEIARLRQRRYDTWEWNYGRSPEYSTTQKCRIEGCGTVEVSMSVKKGAIEDLCFYGDFFGSGDLSVLTNALKGCPCRRDAVERLLSGLDLEWYITGITAQKLAEVIAP